MITSTSRRLRSAVQEHVLFNVRTRRRGILGRLDHGHGQSHNVTKMFSSLTSVRPISKWSYPFLSQKQYSTDLELDRRNSDELPEKGVKNEKGKVSNSEIEALGRKLDPDNPNLNTISGIDYLMEWVGQITLKMQKESMSTIDFNFEHVKKEVLSLPFPARGKKNALVEPGSNDSNDPTGNSALNLGCIHVITPSNFASVFLAAARRYNNFPLAQKYWKTLSNKDLTISAISNYISLYADSDQFDETEFTKLMKLLEQRNKGLYDSETGLRIIQSLTNVKSWKTEGVRIMQIMDKFESILCDNVKGKVDKTYQTEASSAIMRGWYQLATIAFKNDDLDFGWEILNKNYTRMFSAPDDSAFITWLQKCPKTIDSFRLLANYLDEREIYITGDNFTNAVMDFFKNDLKFDSVTKNAKLLKVTRSVNQQYEYSRMVRCSCCRREFEDYQISKDELQQLKTAFFDKVVTMDSKRKNEDNIFLSTTPKELKDFQDFIEESGPFNVVIDGLNVAKLYPDEKPGPVLETVIGQIINSKWHLNTRSTAVQPPPSRILLIGRQHMVRWGQTINRISSRFPNIHIFLSNNQSQDDPFILYAALTSGLGCKFVSKDLMRGHAIRLKDPELVRMFKRWRLSHQIVPYCSFNYKKIRDSDGKIPHLLATGTNICDAIPVAHETNLSWHVPYSDDDNETNNNNAWFSTVHSKSKSIHHVPTKWICIEKKYPSKQSS